MADVPLFLSGEFLEEDELSVRIHDALSCPEGYERKTRYCLINVKTSNFVKSVMLRLLGKLAKDIEALNDKILVVDEMAHEDVRDRG